MEENNIKILENLFGNQPKAPFTLVNNPFEIRYISYISMFGSPDLWEKDGSWRFRAVVEFKNGNTKGEQEIFASNMAELYGKVAEFCINI
jgi:hypothetical protein